MHLYIATKGIKMEIDEFIKQLQGKYLPLKYRKTIDEPFQDAHVQLPVRPVQLWEIGYPEGCHDIVCNTILGTPEQYTGVQGNDGKKSCVHKWANRIISLARRVLGLDPIPEWKAEAGAMPIRRQHLIVVGLGTKKDYIMETGVEGL